MKLYLRACLKMVAAEVTRRTAVHFGQEIRLVTSAATMPVGVFKQALSASGRPGPLTGRTNRSHSLGFTKIEVVGVLAIVAIMAAVLYPVVIRRVDLAAKTKEGNDLVAISNSIALNMLRTMTIPSAATVGGANWATFAANWTRTTSNQVAVNPRRNMRHMLFDNGGWLGLVVTNGAWVQTANGATAPTSARAILLSSMGTTLTGQISGSFNLSAGEFAALWDTPDGKKPTNGVVASWPGRADDLVVQRISFSPLFHRLILESSSTNAVYSIGSVVTNMQGPATLTPTYFMNGSDLGLFDLGTNVQRRLLLTRDESFVFDGVNWRDDLPNNEPNDVTGQDFEDLVAQFIAAGTPATAVHGAAPEGVVVGMFNYMLVYSLWANKCPHFDQLSAKNNDQVPEYELMLDVGGGGNSSFINQFSGQNGLLK